MRTLLTSFLSVFVICFSFMSEAQAAQPLSVAIIMNTMGGDKGFGDSLKKGYQNASMDFGVAVKAFYHSDPAQMEKLLVRTAKEGYDLIIIPHGTMRESLHKVAQQYPRQNFAILDKQLPLPNVLSVLFDQKEASFLAGVAAASFVSSAAPNLSGKKIVGWIGGVAETQQILDEFRSGYQQGVAAIDPSITVLTEYAGSFDKPEYARELALKQYKQGASVIMHAAGRSGLGVFQAAKETGRYAIGVDSNQDALLPGQIITSVVKRADLAVYAIIARLANKNFSNETIHMTLQNGGVGLTDMSITQKALGTQFPSELTERLALFQKQLETGALKLR